MLADESSESSSESSDATDDIDLLLLDSLGCLEEPHSLGPCINLEDIEDIDCEQMFRYTSVYISQIQFLNSCSNLILFVQFNNLERPYLIQL